MFCKKDISDIEPYQSDLFASEKIDTLEDNC